MSLSIYLIGVAIFWGDHVYGAVLLNVLTQWMVVVTIITLWLLILAGVKVTREKDSGDRIVTDLRRLDSNRPPRQEETRWRMDGNGLNLNPREPSFQV